MKNLHFKDTFKNFLFDLENFITIYDKHLHVFNYQKLDKLSEKEIDLIIDKRENNIVISVKDYGTGLPDSVKDKLFKEMITTKGKNGTGLGLFMSYSTIKAHFNGNITFETEKDKGTTFNIIIPM